MRKTQLSSITDDDFRVWVQIHFLDDASKACNERLATAIRSFMEKRYRNCRPVIIQQSMVTTILERFSVHPSIQSTNQFSSLESSLSMRVTSRGISFDVTKMATLESLSLHEDDETAWKPLHEPVANSVILLCIPKATANGSKYCFDARRWERPLWAWTMHDRLLAHATVLIIELMEQIPFQTTVIISNSDDDFTGIPLSTDITHRHKVYVFHDETASPQPHEGNVMSAEASTMEIERTNETADGTNTHFERQSNPIALDASSFEVGNNAVSKQNSPVDLESNDAQALSLESLQFHANNSTELSTTCFEDTPDAFTPIYANNSSPIATPSSLVVTPSPTESHQFDSQGIDMSIP